MIINEIYNQGDGHYLKSSQLGDKRPEVVIASAEQETFTINDGPKMGEKEIKPVLSFQDKESLLVLNKTNAQTIAGLYGQNTDNWIGRTITIFGASTLFGGNMVPCIRVCQPHDYHIDMRAEKNEGFAKMKPPGGGTPAPQAQPEPTPQAQPAGFAEDDDVPF